MIHDYYSVLPNAKDDEANDFREDAWTEYPGV
jgi:hypothetical protein